MQATSWRTAVAAAQRLRLGLSEVWSHLEQRLEGGRDLESINANFEETIVL